MKKRLLVVLAIVAAFIFIEGGEVLAQDNPNADLAELMIANAPRIIERDRVAYEAGMAAERHRRQTPLPALPVPPVMTEQGLVQAPNPRPLDNFPVARPRPAAKPQQATKPIPAIKAPPVVTEKGKVETPNPRPTQDFPVAKPQQQAPVAEIKQSKGFLGGKAVVVNQENIHVNVMLSASNNLGRKVAIEVKPGEYILGTGTLQGWDFHAQKTKKVPNGYEIVRGRERKS